VGDRFWTRAYWQTVIERMVGAAASAVFTVLGLDGTFHATVEATPATILTAAAYGALGGLVVSLVSTPFGAGGTPFLTRQPVSAVRSDLDR
jgi:hypothetical protein